ncbi:hypothetical protein A5886_001724 [Enterococcus sp. 8G7_MSG3316]|uniref:Nudix hydrolase domain-containing protein n=1 Tax=Candidatus Enterococcus testudinis TaxID=1834191 RepID=A0A242A6I0_9ENTE|nr:NUDIX domain-containing protein [Enterococcus sp. 8G7_MSG3316]OTN76646.1 hypothetical protein A5886_001724 [Enterococcus sp. 8G7_MSG3316]
MDITKEILRELNLTATPLSNFTGQDKLARIKKLIVDSNGRVLRENNRNIHLSASAVVFNQDTMFFIEHPYLKKRLLPAGHVEFGETPLETAVREFNEETGYFVIPNKLYPLLDVNLINIPENTFTQEPAHTHIDFRYKLSLSLKKPIRAELETYLMGKYQVPNEFLKYFELVK